MILLKPTSGNFTHPVDATHGFDINDYMMRNSPPVFALLLTVVLLSPVRADDWPQWRGPQRNGISKETGLLKSWPKEGPKLLWQAKDVGSGFATPSVVGDRLYFISNSGLQDETVRAISAADGKPAWSVHIGKVGNPNQSPQYPAARSTPTVDGDRLFALGSDGDLVCLETASGKPIWHKNLRKDFGGKPGTWAYAESPLIDGDALVCTPGGAGATLVKLKKSSGDVIWKCAVPGGDEAGYASIIPIEDGGTRQYVQFLAKGLAGVDANTGKVLWRYEHTAKGSPANISTPTAGDGYVYSGSGMAGAGLVKLTSSNGAFKAQEIYFSPKLPSAIGGTVLIGNWLFGAHATTVLECVEFKTGNVKWTNRSVGPASICFAEGRLYLHGENGEVALVEATPDGYHELGRFTPSGAPDRGDAKAWAYPVVANGRLYVRDGSSIWCYDVKGH